MHRLRRLGRSGRVVLAVAVGGAVFGIASAVQADIPDAGVIHGCYGKPGTPQKGQLRVIDASKGEQCRFYESPLNWNQTGPTGPTGPSWTNGLAILDFVATGVTSGEYSTIRSCTGGRIAIGGGVYDATNGANITLRSSGNVGSVTSNTPNSEWQIYFNLTTAAS